MGETKGRNSGGHDIPYTVNNPEQLAQNMFKLFDVGGRALTLMLKDKRSDGPGGIAGEMSEAGNMIASVMSHWLAEPEKFAVKQSKLAEDFVELWGRTNRRYLGEKVEPLASPAPGDSRFRDPEWSENPFFDFCKQAYLLTTHWAENMLVQTEGLDEGTRRKAEWYFRQISSALSPSNFPPTNPEVVRETLVTNAKNLAQGMTHFVEDMEKSGDLLKISQTDTAAFEVGRNLALTPGQVIFQNDILQLIQYAPSTDKVRETPLLIVPPWINKYYILDLTPAKSLIKFLVDQGFTVFMISWVNPDEHLSHKAFEDYMQEGILTAANVVRRETSVETCNVVGYCVGGTLLATTLAYLAARGEAPFGSATFLTTQVDFANAGDLLLFTSDAQLASLEQMMAERGYLDG